MSGFLGLHPIGRREGSGGTYASYPEMAVIREYDGAAVRCVGC